MPNTTSETTPSDSTRAANADATPCKRIGPTRLPGGRHPWPVACKLRLVLTLFAIAGISACSSPGPALQAFSQDALPDGVKVPPGHRVFLETAASGNITYECRPKKDMASQFEWVFVGPDASLRDRRGETVGKYFGPPATWQGKDGSQITGMQLAVAGTGGADIPLQLVKANAANGPGSMQGVSYIQRVNTRGGVAPATACSAASTGQKQVVAYAADYIFWRVQ